MTWPDVKGRRPDGRLEQAAETNPQADLHKNSDAAAFAQVWPCLPDLRAMWWRARRHGARWPAERGVIVLKGGKP
jgi:hypothetical protein